MKFLFLLLLIGSCGKYESSSSARLGQRVSYGPQELNETQLAQKQRICQAIDKKTDVLRLSLPGTQYTFNISETNCSAETSQEESVTVRLEVSSSYIHFVRENGGFFIFKDAETNVSGIFKSYCASDKHPFLHNGNPTWVDQQSNEFCARDANSTCVNFKSGSKEANTDNTYRIVTQDTFKLDTLATSDRYGFYTERVMQSSMGCESGSRLIRARLN